MHSQALLGGLSTTGCLFRGGPDRLACGAEAWGGLYHLGLWDYTL